MIQVEARQPCPQVQRHTATVPCSTRVSHEKWPADKRRATLKTLPLLDEAALFRAFEKHNIPRIHAERIWRFVIQKGVTCLRDIPELPKTAHNLLEQQFAICTSTVYEQKTSRDGSTTKIIVQLQDGNRIECVIMRYGHVQLESFPKNLAAFRLTEQAVTNTPLQAPSVSSRASSPDARRFKSTKRATLCVSSQVGCKMGCTFCATGTMGLLTNLTGGEILEQLYHASKIENIRNVVFMGMGEPLDNYQEVLSAIRGMTDVRRFGLAGHRVTVSTVGVAPRILQLVKDAPGISLALSLHAPNQELRSQIVPSSKAWHVDRIMSATDKFIANQKQLSSTMKRNQIVLIEYVLIDDINDSDNTAHELGKLLECRKDEVHLNVIPYNPTDVPVNYR
eukprot:GHVT01047642.1.p1 GENE.GHVT01047642.1~~GHVT01047642.1.p1  ORF type:complete len:393 (-),score=18.62 GHVT01047642.1:534-1712(-)